MRNRELAEAVLLEAIASVTELLKAKAELERRIKLAKANEFAAFAQYRKVLEAKCPCSAKSR